MKVLSDSERELFERLLFQQHGVEGAFREFILIMSGDGKVRATTADTINVAKKLRKVLQVGLYVAKLRRVENELFLSIEGSQLLDDRLSKNVIELSEGECWEWMHGAPISKSADTGSRYIVGRIDKIYLGSARVSRDNKLYPQIAVWRRLPGE